MKAAESLESTHQQQEQREIRCPRCGYDQRGVVETWKHSCPLEGVCSECGLSFIWPDLFRPERFAPQWCVEFTPRVIGLPWAAARTVIRSCWPWHFWKRVQMGHPIRVLRIVMYVFLLLAPFAILYVVAQGGAAAIVLKRQKQTMTQQQQMLPATLAMWQTAPSASFAWKGPLAQSGFPVGLTSVRLADDAYFEQARKMNIAMLSVAIASPARIEYGYWHAVFEAVAYPLSDSCSGVIHYADRFNVDQNGQPIMRSMPYQVPPSEVWENFSALSGGWGIRSGPIGDLAEAFGVAGIWCMLLLAPLPLSLALLPVTRRRAKVRWAHIGRVFLYSLAIPIVLIELVIAGWLTHTFARPATVDDELWTVLMLFAMPIATIAWWWAAIKHYLRMPHALAVSIIMSVLCVLMIGAIIFVIGETFFA